MLSVPEGHVYVRHLSDPGADDGVVRLPDPPVPGTSPPPSGGRRRHWTRTGSARTPRTSTCDPARDYPEELLAATAPHPARPAPGTVAWWPPTTSGCSGRCLAVTAADWRLLGGFDEGDQGYGADDTDLGQRAASLGGRMWRVLDPASTAAADPPGASG